jgi:hypothetical protein
MFERYTEKARRSIFFARYEASQFGSPLIESEFLLLGLLRESKSLANRLGKSPETEDSIRKEIERHTPVREKIMTSVDLPLSSECKLTLAYAAEEADKLGHRHIGTGHLMLGLLQQKGSLSARLLNARGLQLDTYREELRAVQDSVGIRNRMDTGGSVTAQAIGRVVRQPPPRPIGSTPQRLRLLRSIRIWLAVVITGLVLSGITAFPLEHELHLLVRIAAHLNLAQPLPALNLWLIRVDAALTDTNARYPFLAYGTDWLAFAHLVIAAVFIGPWRDPIRNKWLIDWGLICCAGVLPLALIAGPVRGIPIYWRFIDCCFGIVCCPVFLVLRCRIQQLDSGRF